MLRTFVSSGLIAVFAVPILASVGRAQEDSAEEILRRAIQAVGGERALAALKSPMMWMERGTFYGMGEGTPFIGQYAAKWPDWHRQEIENAFSITVNGDQAWVSSAAGVQKLMETQLSERLQQVRTAWAERLFPLTSEAYRLSRIDGPEVDGRATVGIKVSRGGDRDIKFFFDNETYLIAKIETLVVSPQHGPEPVLSEAFYSEHKSFSGVTMPSKVRLLYDKKLFVEAETIDYKTGATLDPRQFEAPE